MDRQRNYFDRFDIGAEADLTKPQGGMERPHTRAELEHSVRAVDPHEATANYFDRFDTTSTAMPTAASERSWLDALPSSSEVGRQLAMGTGHVIDGAGGALGFFANPLNTVVNAVLPGDPLSTNVGEGWSAALGLPQPQTRTERLIGDVAKGASAGIFTAGGAEAGVAAAKAPGIARSFAQFLADAPVVNTVAGGSSGLAAGTAREAGYGPTGQALAGLAGGFGGGVAAHVAGIRAAARARGINLDNVPDHQLVSGSLDGGVTDGEVPLDTVDSILRAAGQYAGADAFSTPEGAATAAQRVQAAQERVPVNGRFNPNELPDAVPPRVVPDDVPIVAAPEGNIRADDAGGIAGVERKRAADRTVLNEAQQRVADDPLVASILDSNLSPQMKVATIWQRLAKQDGPGSMPDLPKVPTAQPWAAPDASSAANTVERQANPRRSRIYDITMQTESGGNDAAVSPKGAKGRMQVMDATNSDPGFGVHPAQNGSMEERARVGRDYIDALQRHYGGDMEKAWAAYNGGPGAVDGAIAKHGRDWLQNLPSETRAYVNKNMAALGGARGDVPYRAADYSTTGPDYSFDAFDAGAPLRRNTTDNRGEAEVPESYAARSAREAASSEMATGNSTRPFRADPDPGDFEARAHASAQSQWQQAQADLEAEWSRREQARAEREANRGADERFQRERANTEAQSRGDPSGIYRGKYAQKPHNDGGTWSMTREGFVAGGDGNPVAFRSAREAATWAAKNEMGGDFELGNWATNSKRVVLKRREGSTYGDAPARPVGPQEPPAGRSTFDSQRMLEPPAPARSRASVLDDAPAPERTPDITPPVERASIPPETRPPLTGSSEQVVTPRGRLIDTQFEVREASDLIDSAHPAYDQQFQPRDRGTRAASDAQIAGIASRLDPQQLNNSRLASQGAPVVGPDRMVESGNGRIAAIRRAYTEHPEQAQAYRKMIQEQGFDTAAFERPVLVRRRTTALEDANRRAFVREANERDTMGMSSSEQAKADAGTMSLDTLGLHRGGGIASEENRAFVRRWLNEVVPISEHNTLTTRDGQLNVEGIRRIRSAMLAKAYDDADLVARLVENPDNNIRSIGTALADTAPAMSQLRARVQAGDLANHFDVTPQISEIANLISQARESGKSLRDLLGQHDMFDGQTDKITEALGRLFFRDEGLTRPRSVDAIRNGLQFYADEAAKVDGGPGLFGEVKAVGPLDILQAAQARMPDVAKGEAGYLDLEPLAKIFKSVANSLVDGEDIGRDLAAFKRRLGDPKAAVAALTRPMRDSGSALLFTNDGVMRSLSARFSSPAIAELADKFHARAGKGDGTARTYHEAVQQAAITRISRAHEALEPFLRNQASLGRIRDLLATPNKSVRATVEERAAAAKLRDLLKETLAYRKKAGEDIGEVTDGYFPRVLDEAKVAKGRDEFLRRAEQLYRGAGASDAKVAAQSWFERVFDTYSGLDGALEHRGSGAGGIGGNTSKAREFGKEADELLRDFYHDDVFQTLASYFTGSARRAEEVRRFGPQGPVGSVERDAWVRDHGEQSQADVLWDRIKTDVRDSGIDAGDVLHRLQKAYNANLGRVGSVSHTTRTIISYAHAWNQISKMDRTLVTSLGELTMGFIRGGPKYGVSFVKDATVEFGRQLVKAKPSDAQRWAEAISVAQDSMVNQALTSRISAEGATQGVQKTLAGYYRGILLHQFTEAERTAATRMGRKFISSLAGDMTSSSARVRTRASRYLQELGIQDPQAFGAMLRNGEPDLDQVRRDAPGLAADYATALIRFVNQTVMAPSRAEKPAWSAHPVGSLFSSLLGYSFAFKKNVLDRVGRMGVDAFKDKDPALLLPAAMLPIMGAFQYLNDTHLRPALFGSSYDFSEETPAEAALRVADRAGFTGPMSPIINAFRAIKYKRSLSESLSGPVIGSALSDAEKIATPFIGQNSANTNTAERNAAAAFYDAIIEPAIDAVGAKYLKGALRTATIVGTGNKKGGALPGDKDLFVDEVGGEEE